ncbi:MAG: class I SAM-dependent methyltransferase [Armatimonadia bacterium]
MRRLLPVTLLPMLLCLAAHADDTVYKQDLIARFPFYNVATQVWAPVYPALARQLVQDYGLSDGVCVDVGGAEGSLAMELAKLTPATVYVVDIDPAAVRLCNLLADEAKLTGRVRALEGDAQNLPLRDNFANFVVSRNSLFDWPDQMAGLKEAYRILKPGGVAYLGGGLSRLLSPEDTTKLVAWCEAKRAQKPGDFKQMPDDLVARLQQAGIAKARVIEGPTRFDWWLEMRK